MYTNKVHKVVETKSNNHLVRYLFDSSWVLNTTYFSDFVLPPLQPVWLFLGPHHYRTVVIASRWHCPQTFLFVISSYLHYLFFRYEHETWRWMGTWAKLPKQWRSNHVVVTFLQQHWHKTLSMLRRQIDIEFVWKLPCWLNLKCCLFCLVFSLIWFTHVFRVRPDLLDSVQLT